MSSAQLNSPTAMPRILYGTAWKEDRTADLTYQAIKSGFRGIDTANSRKHYREDLAGAGIKRAISEGLVTRRELFIQTKFTPFYPGDDPAHFPYDVHAPIERQVEQSLASSLRNLCPEGGEDDAYLDALVLHAPFPRWQDTRTAFQAIQAIKAAVPSRVRMAGVSNISAAQLSALKPQMVPDIVQNRFYFKPGMECFDWRVRQLVEHLGIPHYQGFWILSANEQFWSGDEVPPYVRMLSDMARVTPAVAFYALVAELGVTLLDGTTRAERMLEDLEGLAKVDAWKGREENKSVWDWCFLQFMDIADR